MSKVTKEALRWAYKPFDVVTDQHGNVGFIEEVCVNECQGEPQHQISYSVKWLIGRGEKSAWYKNHELTVHCNIFIKIAESACPSSGRNERYVKALFGAIKN